MPRKGYFILDIPDLMCVDFVVVIQMIGAKEKIEESIPFLSDRSKTKSLELFPCQYRMIIRY